MPTPLVSFCIATHNRGPVVLDCLKQVIANGLPGGANSHFEIRIIDNASTDNTPDLIERERKNLPNLHLTRLPKNCGPVGKNIALRAATGEFLVVLDDDAYPHPSAVPQMIRHFRDNPQLAAAVFDVTLPDGSKEGSAYPDVFIGAGTGLRRAALEKIGAMKPGGPLPSDFFMQAEEYDLSFRLLEAGFSVQRFWDLPLTHLKAPNARIGQRTTRLDVRNNMYLLARYVPEPLCHQFAADWLARYFLMAQQRDAIGAPAHPEFGTHKQAFLAGAAQGLTQWSTQRRRGEKLLSAPTLERIFKFHQIRDRLHRAARRLGAQRLIFAEFGKNLLPFHLAAQQTGLDVIAIADDQLGGSSTASPAARNYRGVPLLTWKALQDSGLTADMVVLTNISPVHAPKRAAALRRLLPLPVVDLFSRQDHLLHGPPVLAGASGR
jgi:hypothetical protein